MRYFMAALSVRASATVCDAVLMCSVVPVLLCGSVQGAKSKQAASPTREAQPLEHYDTQSLGNWHLTGTMTSSACTYAVLATRSHVFTER